MSKRKDTRIRPQIAVRLTPDTRAAIDAQLEWRRQITGENATISDWMREAVREKLANEEHKLAVQAMTRDLKPSA